jgi:plasmid maintenance system antidote protein VapI
MARTAIYPGEHLLEQLEELEMSAAQLAHNLKVPTNRVTGILKRLARVSQTSFPGYKICELT